jgi:hypothetical protein
MYGSLGDLRSPLFGGYSYAALAMRQGAWTSTDSSIAEMQSAWGRSSLDASSMARQQRDAYNRLDCRRSAQYVKPVVKYRKLLVWGDNETRHATMLEF